VYVRREEIERLVARRSLVLGVNRRIENRFLF
jgi:hypothetical protein